VIRSSVLPSHPFTYFSKEKVEAEGDFFPLVGRRGGLVNFPLGWERRTVMCCPFQD